MKRIFPGVSELTLGVASVERAVIFYEKLGWRSSRAASSPETARFALNNLVLTLRAADALAESLSADDAQADAAIAAFGQYYGSAGAVEHAMNMAAAAGARVLMPAGQSGGGMRAAFTDPDGHIWTIAFDPARPPGPDGSISLPA